MSFTSEQPGTTRSLPSSASAIVVSGMEVHLDRFEPADVQAVLGRRYIVGPEIGAGGQGVVFRATRIARPDGKAAHDDVALKLHFCLRQDIRVQREIAAMENVCHANMARLIEHGFCDVPGGRTPYLAWEFIEGLPVHVQLKSGPLLESEVLAIGRDVSAAISEIWSRRIVHGDIKPSNIMVRNSGGYLTLGSVESAVLIDLGAAKYLDQENARTLRPSRDVDPTDAPFLKPVRTRGYSSPEQIKGVRALTCASDVFSLGIVMLQCLLGRHPTDHDEAALLDGIRASGRRVAASASLLRELDRMLSQRPMSRPNPAELSRTFQSLRKMMQAGFSAAAAHP
jgi:eukaryotic-like serine/threonine-protein kinase